MLIELCKDIAEDACNGKERAIQFLTLLLLAHRQGKHLVFFSHEVADMLVKSDLPDSIRRICDSIGQQTSKFGTLSHSISIKLVISQNKYSSATGQKIILLNPYTNTTFEVYEETHLLTENLQDADFYLAIVSYYKRKKRLNTINVSFFPLQGGGDTISCVMEKEMALGNHLCLAITDSDMKYEGSKKGGTYKKLLGVMKLGDATFCGLYCMNKVREVENLIPYHLIYGNANYKSNKLVKEDFDFDMSFFDMKEGIRTKNLGDDKFVAFWRKIFGVHHKNYSALIKQEVRNKDKKQKTRLHNGIILDGFGSKLLGVIWKTSQKELMRIEETQLSQSQKAEWMEIGQVIFEWCCASKVRN